MRRKGGRISLRVAIGADHGGFILKERLVKYLKGMGCEVSDFGTHTEAPCDYPLIGYKVAKAVSHHRFDRGILVCKSGIGQCIVANKLPGIRAALCYKRESAVLSRQHNDANILVLGSLFTDKREVKDIVRKWLTTDFEGGRHKRRLGQLTKIEKRIRREG